MTTETTPVASRLENFAREYLAPFSHHAQIRSEHLAEAFRSAFGLPDFPTETYLLRLCEEIAVEVGTLPFRVDGLRGLNERYADRPARILLAPNLASRLVETTIPHELREVIENMFWYVDSSYVGLDTNDNATMNPVSDRFAGYLLMPTEPSRALMAAGGYDLLEFSRRTGRSLSSVLLRARQLFAADSRAGGPVMGAWLFEADWDLVTRGSVAAPDLLLRHSVALSGFSQARGRREAEVFPRRPSNAGAYQILQFALDARATTARRIVGFDLFPDRDYFVVAEPELRFNGPWRVLLTAVRHDCIPLVTPWLRRLGLTTEVENVEFL